MSTGYQPITNNEHEIILDALVTHMDKLSKENHPIIHGRVFDVYQKMGQALGETNIELTWVLKDEQGGN